MSSRRVLVTGLSTYWGGRLAQALEGDSEIEAIIGVDNEDPTRELERTEYVRVGTQHALLRRIVEAAEIDTVVDTRLVVDSTTTSPRAAHENNVIGTMNILAACSGTSVRKFVFKSSCHYYGCEQDDPAFFTEAMGRPHPPRTPIERDIVEAEATVSDFAERNPDVSTTILGFDPRYQFVHQDDVVVSMVHGVVFDLPGVYNVAADGVLALSEVMSLLGKRWAPILPPIGTGLAVSAMRRAGLRIPPEMLQQLRFGRGVDNRRYKATGFNYRYTTREAVLALGEHMRLHPVMRGMREPYRYEREVEDFLRWSPHVRNPAYRKEGRLSREEQMELQRLLSSYSDRVGTPAGSTRIEQAEDTLRAASEEPRTGDDSGDGTPATGDTYLDAVDSPRATPPPPGGEGRPPDAAAMETAAERVDAPGPEGNGGAAPDEPPVDHYDDLDPEEVLSLLESLESVDLVALRDYERSARARPRIIVAIDGVLARREAGQRG